MAYATGWQRVTRDRHAVRPGTREALCGARLVHFKFDGEFGAGGLGVPPCAACLDLAA
jgi:hypothetical protein